MASYLQVENISKSYGNKVLFDHISFNINEGDKIALIAPNGTGKSSLLKILAGKDSSDRGGEIKFMRNIVTAFLGQELQCDPAKDVLTDVVSRVDMNRTHEELWDVEVRASQILTDLGITDLTRRVANLSGGERKRVDLAGVLVQNADFIIMDEPTNHLDLEAIEYLEEYLSKSRRTLFMVTHDRYFLDRVCNSIFELDGGNIYTYRGNYSYYLEKREERLANFQAETDKYRNLFRRELEWIHSTPCARTGKARYRINAFYDIKERAAQHRNDKAINIAIDSSRLGKKIVNCKDVAFGFGDNCIVDGFTYNFAPGEKVGIVGRNGVGKSTFLDLLTGRLRPTSGEIELGTTVRFGYYRQEGIDFREDQTVIETVREIAETIESADGARLPVTTFLQQFLFPPQMFNTRLENLSGGEKRRLYLLTVLMRHPNVLLLDEPTNDLDIVTLNVLEEYLHNFDGSLIIVSHDRFFLDKTVDHLFVLEGEGRVKDFAGTYSEYHEFVKENAKASAKEKKVAEQGAVKEWKRQPDANGPRKLTFKEKRELEQLERDIDALNEEKKALEEDLSSGNLSVDELNVKSRRIGEVMELLDEKEMRWLELAP